MYQPLVVRFLNGLRASVCRVLRHCGSTSHCYQ